MKYIITIFSLIVLINFSYGQDTAKINIDTVIIQSKLSTGFALKLLNDCKYAKEIAQRDIDNDTIFLLLVGGIGPVELTTDYQFEKKYNLNYYDFGDLPANRECIKIYNRTVFNLLTLKYGKSWKKEVRKDVVGLKDEKVK